MPPDAKPRKLVAVIPARGGSKRLPRKNLYRIAGHPLLAHTILQASASEMIEAVYVSTDDDETAEVAERYGAKVIERPAKLSGDQASSESALLHALDAIDHETGTQWPAVMLLQCTSPVRDADDIDNAARMFWDDQADSLLSACPTKHFIWKNAGETATPVNYDFANRPRSQDLEPQFQENGSIYVTRSSLLRDHNCRLGGKITIYPMGFWSRFEIDDEDDIRLIEWILQNQTAAANRQIGSLGTPKLLVFDFDGVMTDNTAVVDDAGGESVRINRSDGLGIDLLREHPVKLLVLSSEKNPVVRARCAKLGIECINGTLEKGKALAAYLAAHGIDAADIVYVGNDLNDLDCFTLSGCSVAVADAHPELLRRADIVLSRKGGEGAVREVCEMVLHTLDK